ncbi:MAG TPA: formyl transferase [Longimicrobium sp.]|nr:formyl transferase [Longimicrobium sp.]
MTGRVLLLGGDAESTRIVFHALDRRFPGLSVVLEPPVPRRQLLARRVRRLGVATVAGQLLFMTVVLPRLRRAGAARVEEICREHGLDRTPIPEDRVCRVPSVNSDAAREALRRADPAVVVVNGTRIIGRQTLAAAAAPFVNLHAGITPLYRGVHGGYWALAEGRPELAGTTVHLVDEGVDTGTVLAQARFTPGAADSFATYPYLHLAVGLPPLADAVAAALEGDLRPRPHPALPSRLRTHPTLWQYARTRLKNVR